MSVVTKAANSWNLLIALVLGTWIIAAIVFALFEGTSLIDSLYWSSTTMTTVGYGDISPVTVPGKIITMAFQFFSIFYLVPCAVANIVDSVRVDEHKETHEEQEWKFNALEIIADAVGKQLPPQPKDY